MLADFVVLSKDIFTAPAADVPAIRAVITVIGGKVAFDASAAPVRADLGPEEVRRQRC